MTLKRRWKLLVIGSLALVSLTALIGIRHGTGPKAGEDRPTALRGHKFPVRALAFGPDGTTLTSAACHFRAPEAGVELIAWDVPAGRRRTTHTASQEWLSALALSAGGGTLAATGAGGAVRWWDTTSLQPLARLGEDETEVCALAFSADGTALAAADQGKRVILWEASGHRRWVVPDGHAWPAFALAFAPDGRTLASGSFDAPVRLWDVATGAERGVLGGHASRIAALAFSPDGRVLAGSDYRHGVVTLWDMTSRTERALLETTGEKDLLNEIPAVAFAPDGRTLAVAAGREVQLWDVAAGRLVACLAGHEGKVLCLAYSSDGSRLASGGYDRSIRLWDVARYRTMRP